MNFNRYYGYLLLLVVLLLSINLFSQNRFNDIIIEVDKQTIDTQKVNLLNTYFNNNKSISPDIAKASILMAISIAEKKQMNAKLINLYNDIGTFYDINGISDSAFYYLNKSLQLATQLNDQQKIGLCYKNIGIVYYDIADYLKALSNFFTSLKINEKINNRQGIADALIWIGTVNEYGLLKFRNAITYYTLALTTYKKINAEVRMSYCYNNLGNSYNKLKMADSAIYFLSLSLDIKRKKNDSISIGNSYNNIGTVYYDIKSYDKSMEYYLNALNIREKLNDYSGTASSLINIGNVYLQMNEFEKAIASHRSAKKICQKIAYNDGLLSSLDGLAETYARKGDYTNAYKTKQEYESVKDSIFNINAVQQMDELQVKYETEKKENEIIQQKLKLSNRNILLGTLLTIFILSLVTFYLSYNRYKLQQEKKLHQELFIEQQKRTKAILESEENERQRIARELHDGIGQMLTATKLNLSTLNILNSTVENNKLKNSLDILDDSINEIRNISHNMVPDVLLKFGLKGAVTDFINRINQTKKLKIDFECIDFKETVMDDTSKLMLYRIIQESVSNTIKYAEATHLNIQITADDNEISLLMEDNGKGFDVAKAIEKAGIGLKNMQLRTDYLKGKLEIDSSLKNGTTIIIEIPLS